MNKKKIFGILNKIAEDLSPVSSAKIAAALVYKGNIVSLGTNQYKTHPMQKKFSSNPQALYLHAEIHAIVNALKKYEISDLMKMTIYVSRIKKENNCYVNGLAKPCDGCASAIKAFGINKVYYSVEKEIYNET